MPITKVSGKKDGLQKYRVRVNYCTPTGEYKQIERTAYGMDQAKALERQLAITIKEAPHTAALTYRDLYAEYIARRRQTIRESTLDKEQRITKLHIMPFFADKKLTKINTPMLEIWKDEIERKNLALNTRKNIFKAFNTAMKYAVKMDYIPQNPLDKIERFRDAYAAPKEINYYTADEWRRFHSSARSAAESSGFYEWHYYVFFCIAFFTGARKGEIYALKWSDIQDRTLKIRRSICQKLKGEDRETPPKNRSSIRDIQIPAPLMQILKEHRKRCGAAPGFSAAWRICGGPDTLRDSTVNNRNALYAEMAELKSIRIHDFRHSHASLLANEGINIQEIARRLGHSKIEITWNTYSHLYPREEERALKVLDTII